MAMNRPIRDWSAKRGWLLGASSGIGAALARALLARGARVALSARRGALLDALVAPYDEQRACALPLDVTDAERVAAAEQALVTRWGGYDLVVMLAGDYQPHGIAIVAFFKQQVARLRTVTRHVGAECVQLFPRPVLEQGRA